MRLAPSGLTGIRWYADLKELREILVGTLETVCEETREPRQVAAIQPKATVGAKVYNSAIPRSRVSHQREMRDSKYSNP